MYLRLVFFIEVTSNFLSPERGYAERECMSLRSAPPFYKTPYNIFTRAAAFCGRFCVAS